MPSILDINLFIQRDWLVRKMTDTEKQTLREAVKKQKAWARDYKKRLREGRPSWFEEIMLVTKKTIILCLVLSAVACYSQSIITIKSYVPAHGHYDFTFYIQKTRPNKQYVIEMSIGDTFFTKYVKTSPTFWGSDNEITNVWNIPMYNQAYFRLREI